jgi:hypothetical protein
MDNMTLDHFFYYMLRSKSVKNPSIYYKYFNNSRMSAQEKFADIYHGEEIRFIDKNSIGIRRQRWRTSLQDKLIKIQKFVTDKIWIDY